MSLFKDCLVGFVSGLLIVVTVFVLAELAFAIMVGQ
jgi:hypothetical protein